MAHKMSTSHHNSQHRTEQMTKLVSMSRWDRWTFWALSIPICIFAYERAFYRVFLQTVVHRIMRQAKCLPVSSARSTTSHSEFPVCCLTYLSRLTATQSALQNNTWPSLYTTPMSIVYKLLFQLETQHEKISMEKINSKTSTLEGFYLPFSRPRCRTLCRLTFYAIS